jgi:hypothetical protein
LQIALLSTGVFKLFAYCQRRRQAVSCNSDEDSLRIEAIGLSGYYSTAVPVAVQIHLPASPQMESLRLDFTVRSTYFYGARGIVRTDHFLKTVSLPAAV